MNKKLILLMVIASFLGSVSKAQTPKIMTAKQVTIRDKQVEINYYQQGQGNTTLLFIHGWCINGMYWKNQVEYFYKMYNVFAIDLPGFGKSKAIRSQWTIEEYANDVTAFIDTMNLKNVVIIGHSMAGDIMLQTALSGSSRVKGVVGVDNFKVLDVEFSPEEIEQMTSFFPLLLADFKNNVTVYADYMLFHAETKLEFKQRLKSDLSASDPTIAYNSFMNQMTYSQQETKLLQALPYKLNLINSNYYPTNTAGLENHCKNGFNLKVIEGAGHYPMIEKPDEFNRLLEEILSVKEE